MQRGVTHDYMRVCCLRSKLRDMPQGSPALALLRLSRGITSISTWTVWRCAVPAVLTRSTRALQCRYAVYTVLVDELLYGAVRR